MPTKQLFHCFTRDFEGLAARRWQLVQNLIILFNSNSVDGIAKNDVLLGKVGVGWKAGDTVKWKQIKNLA